MTEEEFYCNCFEGNINMNVVKAGGFCSIRIIYKPRLILILGFSTKMSRFNN